LQKLKHFLQNLIYGDRQTQTPNISIIVLVEYGKQVKTHHHSLIFHETYSYGNIYLNLVLAR